MYGPRGLLVERAFLSATFIMIAKKKSRVESTGDQFKQAIAEVGGECSNIRWPILKDATLSMCTSKWLKFSENNVFAERLSAGYLMNTGQLNYRCAVETGPLIGNRPVSGIGKWCERLGRSEISANDLKWQENVATTCIVGPLLLLPWHAHTLCYVAFLKLYPYQYQM